MMALLNSANGPWMVALPQFVPPFFRFHGCAPVCIEGSDLPKRTATHSCAHHFFNWGSSGRRFKSCQPDTVMSHDIGIGLNLR
jgi:hypothetical protein